MRDSGLAISCVELHDLGMPESCVVGSNPRFILMMLPLC